MKIRELCGVLCLSLSANIAAADLWSAPAGAPSRGAAIASPPQAAPKTMDSIDYSDLWWNSGESGWGMQINESAYFMFVTLFIYGSDGSARFATAQLTHQGNNIFSGPLYVTTGDAYSTVPFDPTHTVVQPAGTMAINFQSDKTAQMVYVLGGVQVMKNIERQSLLLEPISGNYVGVANLQTTGCTNPASNIAATVNMTANVAQGGTSATVGFVLTNGGTTQTCTLNGNYAEAGRLGEIHGSYTCTSGEAGTMNFVELTNRIAFLTGRINGQSSNFGCTYAGRFTLMIPGIY